MSCKPQLTSKTDDKILLTLLAIEAFWWLHTLNNRAPMAAQANKTSTCGSCHLLKKPGTHLAVAKDLGMRTCCMVCSIRGSCSLTLITQYQISRVGKLILNTAVMGAVIRVLKSAGIDSVLTILCASVA
jgi:hypothetical protein